MCRFSLGHYIAFDAGGKRVALPMVSAKDIPGVFQDSCHCFHAKPLVS